MNELLKIENLIVRFHTDEGVVQALNGITFDIGRRETVGLVGETGCGKTMTAFSILRLIPPPGKIEGGSIIFDRGDGKPEDILKIGEKEMRKLRGNRISMVFQEPSAALNPVFTIGDQIAEVVLVHGRQETGLQALESVKAALLKTGFSASVFKPFRTVQRYLYGQISRNPKALLPRFIGRIPLIRGIMWRLKAEALKKAVAMLKEVEIPDAARVAQAHPHQLSGGMKQRSVIAMALAHSPQLLLADEPTTALDVTIQSQILVLLNKLKNDFNASILYITHDLGVASEICDRIGVMYAGTLVEIATTEEIFLHPAHPYTRALMVAVPRPGVEPKSISGSVPDPIEPPSGCRFHPRCDRATAECREISPVMREVSPGHLVACYNIGDDLGNVG
ncbi:MAG: ABC transporter ATP-binding protein [Dehalogenimonas sp.]|uniref:Nickel import system ATP-binding protein NikD n=1 Tax=Candidatus Dehalogenimonas loeffleri TaxID=3127115 RepID=A0ABZ2J2Q1_9CHLR|nr:ABC transporter ATP-binding protein [Dehalogenimonas sp.]